MITYDSQYNGKPILADDNLGYGCEVDILARLEALLTDMTQRHCKVLFIRFDVRFPKNILYPNDNTMFRNFMATFAKSCQRKGQDPAYLWVREQSHSQNQHYHCVLLLDGNKVQKYYTTLQRANSLWSKALGVENSEFVHFCDTNQQNGLMIRHDQYAQEGVENSCFEWGSYLAKINTKDDTLYSTRSVGNSRIPQDLYQQSLSDYKLSAI